MRVSTTFWRSETFTEAQVQNLASQIAPHTLELTQLRHCGKYRGWWAKMEIFAPWNAHLRPCLHLDLDTQLFDGWEALLELDPTKFHMLRGFVTPAARNSGIMVVPKATRHIWREFAENATPILREYRGDSDFLAPYCEEVIQDHVTGIVSYKYDCHRSRRPEARVVCLHGNPRPWDVPEGYWAREHWESHANRKSGRTA